MNDVSQWISTFMLSNTELSLHTGNIFRYHSNAKGRSKLKSGLKTLLRSLSRLSQNKDQSKD